MHKSYQSTLPASNRLLKKKWDDKYYDEHRLLVRDARPSIDTRPPRTFMHLHMKLKKLQLQEERTATIERDNRILLEKMSNTMRTTGYIDHRNYYEARSLNQEKRRRELLRVSEENGTLAKRIVNRKPSLARKDWEHSSQRNNKYLNNISKYENNWFAPKSAKAREEPSDKPTEREPSPPPPPPPLEEKKGVATLVKSNPVASTKGSNDKASKNQQASSEKSASKAQEPSSPPPEEKKGLASIVKSNPVVSTKGGNDKTNK